MIYKEKLDKLIKSPRITKLYYLSILLIFLYFIIRTIEVAVSIHYEIAPDELEHINISLVYSKYILFIENTPETYSYGPQANSPYLFYFLMGKILNLNWLGFNETIILRIFNILFSIVTLAFTFMLARQFTNSKIVHIVSILLLSNLPMFTFLSASVNYDNLVNMFSVMSIYYLFLYYRKREINNLILYVTFTSLGLITKITFLPLALITAILALFQIFKMLKKNKTDLRSMIRALPKATYILFFIATFSILLVSNLYVTNLISYRNILPKCTQVMSSENCERNPAVVRDKNLIENKQDIELMDRYNYFDVWSEGMLTRTIGIFGHDSLLKPSLISIPYEVIFTMSILFIARKVNTRNSKLNYLLIILLGYSLFLFNFINYPRYLVTGVVDVALQGRYIFPVISPLIILLAYSTVFFFQNKFLRIFIIILTSLIFILGDYFYFKRNVPETWYLTGKRAEYILKTNRYFR